MNVTGLQNWSTGRWTKRRRELGAGSDLALTVADLTGTECLTPIALEVKKNKRDTPRIYVNLITHYGKIRSSDRAWAVLVLGVLLYEALCKEDEMMSHSFDRWLQQRPVMTWAATLVTASHLLNILPERVDPFNLGVRVVKR